MGVPPPPPLGSLIEVEVNNAIEREYSSIQERKYLRLCRTVAFVNTETKEYQIAEPFSSLQSKVCMGTSLYGNYLLCFP